MEMRTRMVKYAAWFCALAVLWEGVEECVVDVSVLGVGTSLDRKV
jgi:hypothetical protein